jgi:hypothetical protein
MPKFKVRVTVTAETTYEVEVEASSEYKAEREAEVQWREKLPEDFQVDKGYITRLEPESTQLTWECVECNVPILEKDSCRQDEMCLNCFRCSEAA